LLLEDGQRYVDFQSATGDGVGGGCGIDGLAYAGDHDGVDLVLSDNRLFELTGRAAYRSRLLDGNLNVGLSDQ